MEVVGLADFCRRRDRFFEYVVLPVPRAGLVVGDRDVRVVAEGVADGIGGGVVDGAGESEGSVLVKTPVGSVLSCPSCAGSQAPSGRAAIGVSPRVRR